MTYETFIALIKEIIKRESPQTQFKLKYPNYTTILAYLKNI